MTREFYLQFSSIPNLFFLLFVTQLYLHSASHAQQVLVLSFAHHNRSESTQGQLRSTSTPMSDSLNEFSFWIRDIVYSCSRVHI